MLDALRPTDERANAVEELVGAGELPSGFRGGVNHHARDFFDLREHGRVSARQFIELQVTAAGVKELGEPRFRLVGRLGVLPVGGAAVAAAGVAVDAAIVADHFGMGEPHGAARRTGDGDARHERSVLAEVDHFLPLTKTLSIEW